MIKYIIYIHERVIMNATILYNECMLAKCDASSIAELMIQLFYVAFTHM